MIDLNLSLEQNQILASVKSMLAKSLPVDRFRADYSGPDPLDVVAEFGGFSLSLPEEVGGTGLSVVEDVLVHIELGRHLVSPAALAMPVALRLCHDAERHDIIEALLSGEKTVAMGNGLAGAGRDGDGISLHLYDAANADYALVWSEAGAMLLDIRQVDAKVVVSTDRFVQLSRVTVGSENVVVSLGAERSTAVRLVMLLVSAQMLGMAEAVRDMSVEYAKIRTQFGQPIGAFQAVKHRCADMAIRADALAAQLTFAAIAQREDWADADFHAQACWLLACRYTLENARSAIQVHGGIGFSAECDAHLYLLRAHLFENLGGSTAERERGVIRQPAQSWAIA